MEAKASLPEFYHIRRSYPGQPHITDPAEHAAQELRALLKTVPSIGGKRIAVTAGSRGIAGIAVIIRAVVKVLQEFGAAPFVIPAMGSHGGATAAGQLEVLQNYGISEATIGARIDARMGTRTLQQGDVPFIWAQSAIEADSVFVIGRIKPHTGFVGEVESGLCKMMTIGLGKQEGAEQYHLLEKTLGMEHVILSVAKMAIASGRVLGAIGIVENAYHQTAVIQAVSAENLISVEKELLTLAKKWMPQIPTPRLDVLHVCQMGKEISGSGMDSNIIGLSWTGPRLGLLQRPDMCAIQYLTVGELTAESKGNCIGLGFADGTTPRMLQAIDDTVSRMNADTAGKPEVIVVPSVVLQDENLLLWAAEQSGLPPDLIRIGIIRDTLNPSEMLISSPLRYGAFNDDSIEVLSGPLPLKFDETGRLIAPWDERFSR